ncbi:MAG: hypothetical protein FWC53_03000 [Firmicutes bacterium]|nr:hypothetical protein [Bacillota bacterium]
MRKVLTMLAIIIIMLFISAFSATFATAINIVDSNTTSEIINTKNNAANQLDQYIATYGSQSYGWTAYILHMISIYSLPVCFLGIIVGRAVSICYRNKAIRHEAQGFQNDAGIYYTACNSTGDASYICLGCKRMGTSVM